MNDTIRVLHVFGKLNRGGAESRIMDQYRHIDRERVQFDFVEHTLEHCAYEDEIEQMGGHIYRVPRFRVINLWSYRHAWKELIQAHPEIKVVHGHMTSTAGIYLPIAHKYGHVYTIAHARNAGVEAGLKNTLTRFLRRGLADKCDRCFTCSVLAGEAVFGKKAMEQGRVTTIPNAIDTSRFVYNPEIREQIRSQYGLGDEHFLLGNVGRFDIQKNHGYLLKVFAECYKQDTNCRLMLVGDGRLRSQIEEEARQLQIEDKVIFTGIQKNPADYYQAFDCFVMPSFFEGLPGSAIEAQVSGLPCLLSGTITREAALTENVEYHSIEASPKEWADILLGWRGLPRSSKQEQVSAAGYDVIQLAVKMQHIYEEAAGI